MRWSFLRHLDFFSPKSFFQGHSKFLWGGGGVSKVPLPASQPASWPRLSWEACRAQMRMIGPRAALARNRARGPGPQAPSRVPSESPRSRAAAAFAPAAAAASGAHRDVGLSAGRFGHWQLGTSQSGALPAHWHWRAPQQPASLGYEGNWQWPLSGT